MDLSVCGAPDGTRWLSIELEPYPAWRSSNPFAAAIVDYGKNLK
jgi:hypothetical protein